MENFFDKRLKQAIIVTLGALALLILTKTIGTIIEISAPKAVATHNFQPIQTPAHPKDLPRTITFEGTGEVTAKPDIAKFTITISQEAEKGSEAQQKMANQVNQAIALFDAHGIEKKDIQTKSYTTSPNYTYQKYPCTQVPCKPSKRIISSYKAVQVISLTMRDIDKSETLLTDLAQLEISNIKGPSFKIEDPAKFTAEAKAEAINNAKKEAKIIADNLGITLGKIVAFTERKNRVPHFSPHYAMKATMEADSLSSPRMEVGEKQIGATVSITYEIK